MNSLTDHQLKAAIRVARILDPTENAPSEIDASLPLIISQGEHRAEDLRIGLALLIDAELAFEGARGLRGTSQLAALLALDDAAALRQLGRLLQSAGQLTDRAQIGAAGEAAVIQECREELTMLGRVDLLPSIAQRAFSTTRSGTTSLPQLAAGVPLPRGENRLSSLRRGIPVLSVEERVRSGSTSSLGVVAGGVRTQRRDDHHPWVVSSSRARPLLARRPAKPVD